MSPQSVPESGWYPDPRGAARTYRWWDGTSWTAQLSDDPAVPAPAAGDPPAAPDGPQAATVAGAPAVVRIDPAQTSAYQRAPRDPDRPRTVRPDRVVAAVALAVVLVAVSLVVVLRADGVARNASLLTPPTPVSSRAAVGYDSASRRAQVGDVVATFPTEPFASAVADPDTPAGLFTGAVVSQATVQAKYDGTNDWTASIFLGALDPRVVKPDGTDTAKAVFELTRTAFYAGVDTTYATPKITTTTATGGRQVVGLQVDLKYAVPKVTSTYDRVTILVVAPATGSADQPVAWVSARPSGASQATNAALQGRAGYAQARLSRPVRWAGART